MEKDPEKIIGIIKEHLKYYSELGADFIFSSSEPISKGLSGQDEAWPKALEEQILRCTLCPLSRERKNAVPGEGNLKAELMFVGEAPGQEEDIQGRPFVGKAGQLLTRIIEAMKFQREDVYITNVVKCRPPNNRIPHRDEVGKCSPFLIAQIERIKPKVIVALGKVAADFFIKNSAGMTSLRGNFYDYGGIQVMPTFHPSYVIRNEGNKEIKKMVWKDMQKVMALFGKK